MGSRRAKREARAELRAVIRNIDDDLGGLEDEIDAWAVNMSDAFQIFSGSRSSSAKMAHR
jgi:hypothetical protein